MPLLFAFCVPRDFAALSAPARPVSTTLILIARLKFETMAGRKQKREQYDNPKKKCKSSKKSPHQAIDKSLPLPQLPSRKGKNQNQKKLLLTGRGVVPGVDDHRRCPPRRERREHSVAREEERRRASAFKHPLDDLLAVLVGLCRRLGEQKGVLARVEAEAVREGVVPEGLDGVPVGVGAVGPEGRDDLKE